MGVNNMKRIELRQIIDLLRDDCSAHFCVFVIVCSKVHKVEAALEDLIAETKVQTTVLAINGDMDKHEKFTFVRIFTSSLAVTGFTFHVLVATAAANTGIGQPLCQHVLRVGIPWCLATFLQERGRLVCKDGMTGTFAMCSSWSM